MTLAASATTLEADVLRIGRELLDRARAVPEAAPSRFTLAFQEKALMQRIMRDEPLRVQLLRFVDVLPALKQDRELTRHVEEYFTPEMLAKLVPFAGQVPGLANLGLRGAKTTLGSFLLAKSVRGLVQTMAHRFIAGQDPAMVLPHLVELRKQRLAFTLDLLGETTVSESESDSYQCQYLDLIESLSPLVQGWDDDPLLDRAGDRVLPRLNLSIKVSSLFSQLDPAALQHSAQQVSQRLRPILLKARESGAAITLDMEDYHTRPITLRVFGDLAMDADLRDWRDFGLAVQAYLQDTDSDLARLLDLARARGTPFTVRLVRGAYWDQETILAAQHHWKLPVWPTKPLTDACFERSLAMLMQEHQHIDTAIATHNARSLAVGLAWARQLGLEPWQYEFQMLHGMADPLRQALVDLQQRVRIYLPVGKLIPGMAYLVRRLLENTSSQSFLRMGFEEHIRDEVLLASPKPQPQALEAGGSAQASRADDLAHSTPAALAGDHTMQERYTAEPVRRFTDTAEVEAFAQAIAQVRSELGGSYPAIIAGQQVSTEQSLPSYNPAHPQELVGEAAVCGPAQVEQAVRAAQAAIRSWRDAPAAERVAVLRKAAQIMRDRRDSLAAWQILEAGKTWREADADVVEAIDFLEFYSHCMLSLSQGQVLDVPGETNRVVYEGRGIVAVIAPWNFPLAIVTGMTAAALVTGNAALVKPAPQTPVMAAKLCSILLEAGVPAGVLHYLPGGDAAGEALVSHPGVHVIAFTGSVAAGAAIARSAADLHPAQQHFKHVIAEMGGKNAIIVDDDADLDDAVRGIVASAFGFQGQKCSAASRVIVLPSVREELISRLVNATWSLQVGDPADPATRVGPVIDDEARQRIEAAKQRARLQARSVLEVDVSSLSEGYYVGPAIYTDVKPDSELAQEEIFGPVLAVLTASSFEQALELANDTRYGLTAGVYSRSPVHLELARRTLQAGNLYLNRKITGAVVGRQPFGGVKLSGTHARAGGCDYLLHFLQSRTITENTLRHGFAPDAGIDSGV